MVFRFLHASDLHLGKPFGGYPEGIRGRLREARHGAIGRLAVAARQGGAGVILLAGDTFDAETPAPDTLRQALQAMAGAGDLTWVLMPGNHDSLAGAELWRRIGAGAAPNLLLALEPAPIALAPGSVLLPAPCTQRRPGRDLTEWFGASTPEGQHRIGLAHGAITDFTGEEGTLGIIPPDRAALSGLDYLALGDWHGRREIGPRTWYSGTPEAEAFKHPGPAGALLVTLAAPGALPQVAPVATGALDWQMVELALLPGEGEGALAAALPPVAARRDTLVKLVARGRLALPERAALSAACAAAAPDFGWFDADFAGLATEARPDDLDLIDRGGALRAAAEALLAEAENPALAAAEREVAAAALSRLFALSQEALA
ncbi:DNA repair exonuclease [Frigidibacter albus]|uniref:DNA repair exonuclease n=1 Tax=Frigidibacter albus TaxID=1465486 RepID=A0A6L8VFG0_9RHOB|nr:DNA repair exonuclease [Frigidibacter albus]MZQ89097.1 DNA repair exonuclease [Frigidibacter albus]NBE30846.1 DNA repair exonuclease [Frigidibacter albus]GGH51460.1 hypothetical protein GCM10011341_15120 [Frigidibacter albus]